MFILTSKGKEAIWKKIEEQLNNREEDLIFDESSFWEQLKSEENKIVNRKNEVKIDEKYQKEKELIAENNFWENLEPNFKKRLINFFEDYYENNHPDSEEVLELRKYIVKWFK